MEFAVTASAGSVNTTVNTLTLGSTSRAVTGGAAAVSAVGHRALAGGRAAGVGRANSAVVNLASVAFALVSVA